MPNITQIEAPVSTRLRAIQLRLRRLETRARTTKPAHLPPTLPSTGLSRPLQKIALQLFDCHPCQSQFFHRPSSLPVIRIVDH
jgi:hypothetical protein